MLSLDTTGGSGGGDGDGGGGGDGVPARVCFGPPCTLSFVKLVANFGGNFEHNYLSTIISLST